MTNAASKESNNIEHKVDVYTCIHNSPLGPSSAVRMPWWSSGSRRGMEAPGHPPMPPASLPIERDAEDSVLPPAENAQREEGGREGERARRKRERRERREGGSPLTHWLKTVGSQLVCLPW